MEVHTYGWHPYLQEARLKKQLDPVMAKLGIPDHAFTCEKQRKGQGANVTFLHEAHGRAFLAVHGEQNGDFPPMSQRGPARRLSNATNTQPTRRPRRVARLHVMGSEVFCKISKNTRHPSALPGQPDPITLRAIRHAADEKVNPTFKTQSEGAPDVFELRSLSCGHNVFDGDRLVYIPEVEFEDVGIAKFTKNILLIKLQSKRVIKIQLETVIDLVCSFQHTLTLTLGQEPAFFVDTTDLADLADMFRRIDLSAGGPGPGNAPTRTRICSLDETHAQVVGQCLVYQFQVSGPDLPGRIAKLKQHDVVPFVRHNLITQRTPPLKLGFSRNAMKALMKELADYTQRGTLPFGILFQLQALAWNAYLHPGTVLGLARELRRVFTSDRAAGKRPISVDAFRILLKQIDWARPDGTPSDFEVEPIVELLRQNQDQLGADAALRRGLYLPSQNLVPVYRITVTPTRYTLHGPELEAKNRILRKFPEHLEFFVRVQFCDENGLDLFFNPGVGYDKIYGKFKRVFREGIQIAGRKYEFLGFSHSSLRSHSAWFSAPFVDHNGNFQTYFNIIAELGIFKQILSPARCAARIGQAFSETPYYLSLDEYNITDEDIPDVKSQYGNRVFSDGVGPMSWEALQHIWGVIPQKKRAPTAVQFRFKGYKGMLALDSTLTGSVICLRPSMKKFDSHDAANLEICDTASKPIPLVLNRQMVKILEDMGVDAAWFKKMQSIELARLRAVTTDGHSVARFLKQQNVGEGIHVHRLFRTAENMGINFRQDGFLCGIVEAVVLRELRLLKHKARIPIMKGVTLFGIMDETGFLEEKEVYITYDTLGGRFDPPPGEGPLIVTRSPALHPGDIQFADHVIPPAGHPLREHMNVIVFSSKGDRDLPSQLSGGDLDGDIFNVIWDPEAMPCRAYPPADYPLVEPLKLGHEVTRDDMGDFFVDFMRLDHLGVIATRHMIMADQKPEGTLHPDCVKLAELHSTAVDFSKTGIPVDLSSLPRANRFRPDFLAPGPEARIVDKSAIELDEYIVVPAADEEEDRFSPPRHVFYKSVKILGQLYRAINERKIWFEDVKSKMQPLGPSFWDGFINGMQSRYESIVPDPREWHSHMETAREIRTCYEEAISDLMSQHSDHPVKPITELEVFIGNVLNKSGVQTSRQRDSSIKLKDKFDEISVWITHQMRRVNLRGDVPLTGYETVYDNLHLCLACVHAGGEENVDDEKSLGRRRPEFDNMQSFRVVAACALLSELLHLEKRGSGGGYVGVRSSAKGNGAASNVPRSVVGS